MSANLCFREGLRLHAVGATIWAQGPGLPLTSLRVPLHDFLILGTLRPVPTGVFIYGTAANADLIAMTTRSSPYPVFIAAYPTTLPQQAHPRGVMDSMELCHQPPQQGGWHIAQDADRRMYELYARHDLLKIPEAQYCRAHPAWPLCHFLGLNTDLAVDLLSLIVDPRWFVHPAQPNRVTRLNNYLGLLPRYAEAALKGPSNTTSKAGRAHLVKTLWGMAGDPEFRHRHKELMQHMGLQAATLKVSQKFVQLVWQFWRSRVSQHPEAFVPEYCFATVERANAFREHALAWQDMENLSGKVGE